MPARHNFAANRSIPSKGNKLKKNHMLLWKLCIYMGCIQICFTSSWVRRRGRDFPHGETNRLRTPPSAVFKYRTLSTSGARPGWSPVRWATTSKRRRNDSTAPSYEAKASCQRDLVVGRVRRVGVTAPRTAVRGRYEDTPQQRLKCATNSRGGIKKTC